MKYFCPYASILTATVLFIKNIGIRIRTYTKPVSFPNRFTQFWYALYNSGCGIPPSSTSNLPIERKTGQLLASLCYFIGCQFKPSGTLKVRMTRGVALATWKAL